MEKAPLQFRVGPRSVILATRNWRQVDRVRPRSVDLEAAASTSLILSSWEIQDGTLTWSPVLQFLRLSVAMEGREAVQGREAGL